MATASSVKWFIEMAVKVVTKSMLTWMFLFAVTISVASSSGADEISGCELSYVLGEVVTPLECDGSELSLGIVISGSDQRYFRVSRESLSYNGQFFVSRWPAQAEVLFEIALGCMAGNDCRQIQDWPLEVETWSSQLENCIRYVGELQAGSSVYYQLFQEIYYLECDGFMGAIEGSEIGTERFGTLAIFVEWSSY